MREKNACEPWTDLEKHHVMWCDQEQPWVMFASALTQCIILDYIINIGQSHLERSHEMK